MADNTDAVFDKFFQTRTKPLVGRFPGLMRALVVETNDPLSMGRVRFKCPEMHDFDMLIEDCQWAVPGLDLGGNKAARFVAPTIGDWVWITFEKGHPYGPVWVGFCNPTRRRLYAYPQIFNITPIAFNERGRKEDQKVIDYDPQYLPKDGRPMGHGWVDRYGNMDLHSAVGYFPSEHKRKPAPPGIDAVTNAHFQSRSVPPEVNDPDKKYMARVTKYGHIFIMGDQGYHWQKKEKQDLNVTAEDNESEPAVEDEIGEFTGDVKQDEQFEYKRWLFVQKLLNDNNPSAKSRHGDQRKILMMTRYGSRIEMRDAGWAQVGPVKGYSRPNEFGPRRILSNEEVNDYRWIKIRTKGGMLFQMYDKGTHPSEDKFIKRTLLEDSGPASEKEHVHWGGKKDARFIRIITRYGIKLVLDDRGADERNASEKEVPRGNGFLLKGRKTPSSHAKDRRGDPRGFLFEFNENDEANHMTLASPMGNAIELNDRYQYVLISASLGKGFVRKYRGLKENEFSRKPAMIRNPEKTSHHLKIDHENEYIRLKTRGGKGTRPAAPEGGHVNPTGVASGQLQQGFEARDGQNGLGPWVEIVDSDRRGMWFSKKQKLGIWRAKSGKRMYMWMDESPAEEKIVIYNNQGQGEITIVAAKTVNVVSLKDVRIQADRHVFIKAGRTIRMQAGGTKWTMLRNGNISSNSTIHTAKVNAFLCGAFPGLGAGCPNPGGETIERQPIPRTPELREPRGDRGKTYNGPFEECPIEEVEHEIRDDPEE